MSNEKSVDSLVTNCQNILSFYRPKNSFVSSQGIMFNPEDKKNWKDVHRNQKELRRKYKQENLLRKLERNEKLGTTTSTETEIAVPSKPVSTLSIAVPGSILENAQTDHLRTYLAGQIARAACIFCVDEIIIFDDLAAGGLSDRRRRKVVDDEPTNNSSDNDEESSSTKPTTTSTIRSSCLQLARILQYLECPQYLRKFFFPLHKDLQFSGLLNPLDAPHHLRQQNDFIYREGVVTNKPAKKSKGSFVNIGLLNDCLVDKVLEPGIRVTVKLKSNQDLKSKKIRGKIVSPSLPRMDTGVYWGYTVRIAKSLSDIFSKSPYDTSYDLTIGTSDKGDNVHNVKKASLKFNHALIVYGGLTGLESALENDDDLKVSDPSLLFDHYLNTVPGQGSRTIRTEEAILISLAALVDKFAPIQKPKQFCLSQSIPQSEDTGMKQVGERHGKKRPQQNSNDNEIVPSDI